MEETPTLDCPLLMEVKTEKDHGIDSNLNINSDLNESYQRHSEDLIDIKTELTDGDCMPPDKDFDNNSSVNHGGLHESVDVEIVKAEELYVPVYDSNPESSDSFDESQVKIEKPSSDINCGVEQSCWLCVDKSLWFIRLRSYMLAPNDHKPFCCSKCSKKVTESHNLKLFIHFGGKPNTCGLCFKDFTRFSSLMQHLLSHTGITYTCEVCSKVFQHPSSLKSHMLTHAGSRPHTCLICDKSFKLASYLRRHIGIHGNVTPFSCLVCAKSFKWYGDLKNHMLQHRNKGTLSCLICSRTFTRSAHLKDHMLGHTGERPYPCSICGKRFKLPTYVRRHMITHINKKSQ